MKNNAIWGLTLSLALVSSAVVATAVVRDFDDPVVQKDDKDKAKQEKELAELEAQKAKLEARIGELRKKTGKSAHDPFFIKVPKSAQEGSGIDSEQLSKIIGDAMKTARSAMAEAMKSMPKNLLVMPKDSRAIIIAPDGKSVLKSDPTIRQEGKISILENGVPKIFEFNGQMSDDDKKKFKAAMEEVRKAMQNMKMETKALMPATPFRVNGTPGAPTAVTPHVLTIPRDGDTMSEIKKLREEVARLREEVRKQQDKKPEKESLSRFSDPYNVL